jgi:hypothetical protein
VSEVGKVTLKMRVYYSSYHLWAAKHFVRLAAEIEDAHEGRPRFDIEHRAYVTNAILSSVAFMEAAINELLQDAFDNHQSYIEPLDSDVQTLIAKMWDLTEARNRSPFHILDKCQMVLVLARKKPIPTDGQLFENANLLRKLRNELMHYKPQTFGGLDTHRLDRGLVGRFPPNKLMIGAGNSFFPDHCLGHGCAQWSVTSSEEYMNAFFAELGVVPNYQRVEFKSPFRG